MPLVLGRSFGPYKIVSELGKGGMGEVYRAHDSRLEREVAIKVLSEHLAADPKALARFEREAKTLASLSHPNIVVIHDIGTDRGVSFVAMELLEGETLRNYLKRSPIPWRRALEIGSVVADALAAAHSKGVTHRDLKPENIFLTSTGLVKVLDFGLARMDRLFPSGELTVAPAGSVATESGMLVGTVHYMSPEQARGQTVDNRTDLWAFGCVLYEMLTQQRAFHGRSFSDTIASVLKEEPQWKLLPQDLPQSILDILKRCLQKDSAHRMEDATALKTEIDNILTGITSSRSISRSQHRPRPAKKRIKSLVVLPLTNLSRDPEKEYFADGMTEALISSLAKLGALRIISRTSAMCYKGTTKSLPEIAQELNVEAVLEGSVMLVGQRVRITVQLISAATDTHLWAEDYDRDLQDVLLLQSEVAQTVAQKIQVTVTAEDKKRLQSARKVNAEAYEACLKGRYYLYKPSKENVSVAFRYFYSALEKDPKSAIAYTGIADVWSMRTVFGHVPSSEGIPQAKQALQRAQDLDDSLPEIHSTMGKILYSFDWNWHACEQEVKLAIELNHNYAEGHSLYADILMSQGRTKEGEEEIKRAIELDPLNPFYQSMWGWYLLYMRRPEDAIIQLQKTLKSESNFSSIHQGLWGAYYLKRMYPEALEEAKKFFTILNESEIVNALTKGYAEAGYREAMRLAAQSYAERSIQMYVPASRIARLYAHAGVKEEALQWLEKAFEQRETMLVHLKVAWDWDEIRDHPRFQMLLQQMKFPV